MYSLSTMGRSRLSACRLPGSPPGAIQEAATANDDIKAIIGIYDASLGARSNETSGKAIMARQREADTGTFHFIDNLSRAMEHAGRILIDLIPKTYTGDRVVRIIGEDGKHDSRTLGKAKQDEDAPQDAMEGEQELTPDQKRAQKASKIYDLSVGKYDVAVSVGPSYTTQRMQVAEQITEFVRSFPQAAPVIGDLLVKALDWPNSEEIAERLQMLQKQMLAANQPPPQAAPDPAVMQIEQAKIEAEKLKAQASVMKAQADVRKAELELEGMHSQRSWLEQRSGRRARS